VPGRTAFKDPSHGGNAKIVPSAVEGQDRQADRAAQAAADEINRAGGSAMAVAMDVSDESAVEAGVAAAFERFGSVDILVSNAGIQIVKSSSRKRKTGQPSGYSRT
jgi:NAD(P)-dependent dehydrogenase (short-subunit alcohol dehydrogenase family)